MRPGSPRRSPSGRRRLIDYPRANRTGFWRWIPSWRFVTSTLVGFGLTGSVLLLAAYAATKIPDVQANTTAQTTKVFYSDGSLMTTFSVLNRTIVPIGKMSKNIQNATIAAEDRTFYENKGVSPLGIARAAYNNARGRDLQGGSTITQQYVKNTRIDNSRTMTRKFKEFFISIKINNELSKDQILENYLNTIYFGRNTYGIEAASQSYFQTSALNLTLPQSAYLAGIINGPELYDVLTDDGARDIRATAAAKLRYEHVLAGLVEMDKLSQADADAYAGRFETDVVKKIKPVRRAGSKEDDQTPYLEQMVKAELTTICKTKLESCKSFADIARGGYTVRTTFDRGLIDEAKKAVHDPDTGMGSRKKWPARTQVGLVAVEPATGAVRAIYGGDGKTRFQSAATQDKPQAGSIYKPFTLIAALEGESQNGEDGIGLRSRFSGRSPFRYDTNRVSIGTGSTKVTNFGGEEFGMIDLVKATEHSVNTVYAALNQELGGGERTEKVAERAGLTSDEIGSEVSNTLGNGNPTVADMASAYGTIAAQGIRRPRYVIESVQAPTGAMQYRHDDAGTRVFNKDVMADTTYALRKVVTSGTGAWANAVRSPEAAGKTGTVGGQSRETKAAWFVGFTPQLSTAVVIHRLGKNGEADVVKGWGPFAGRDMQGGMFPVRVWTSFMKAAMDDETFMKKALERQPDREFPEPAWVGQVLNPAPPEPTPSPTPSPSDPQNPGDGQGNPWGNPWDNPWGNPNDPTASPTDGATTDPGNGNGNPGTDPTDTATAGTGIGNGLRDRLPGVVVP